MKTKWAEHHALVELWIGTLILALPCELILLIFFEEKLNKTLGLILGTLATMLLTWHIGKLIKVSGGIMNTHSAEGDCRMELLAAAGLKAGCNADTARDILSTAVTEEGIRILKEAGALEGAMNYAMERILFFLRKRGGQNFKIECMMYANQYGLLAKSDGAEKMLGELKAVDCCSDR